MKASFWILLEIIVLGVLLVQSMVWYCYICWFIYFYNRVAR